MHSLGVYKLQIFYYVQRVSYVATEMNFVAHKILDFGLFFQSVIKHLKSASPCNLVHQSH